MNTITKKFLMGLTGLGLVVFVILHLAGNLTLYFPDSVPFNTYAHALAKLGALKIVAEVGLAALILGHAVLATYLYLCARKARPVGYAMRASKGSPSKAGPSASYMIVSGTLLLAFVVIHVSQFTLGPGVEAGYIAAIGGGEQARDLYRLVHERFAHPGWVAFYVVAMLFLALHLRHGFWSAFQSLGAMSPRYSKCIHCAGLVLAALLAIGFLMIPVWIYFGSGGAFNG